MLESLYIGMTGLQGFSKGLRVISNNVTNLNTPGFKGSQQQFGDLFYQDVSSGGLASGTLNADYGTGVQAHAPTISFRPGEIRSSNNPLDVAIDGDGFFVVQQGDDLRYTRAGQFEFNANSTLVLRGTGQSVLGYQENGSLGTIGLDGQRIHLPKATSEVTLQGNLSATATEFSIDSVRIIDSLGGETPVRLTFRRDAAVAGSWSVTVQQGTTTLGTANVAFADGRPVAGSDAFTFTLTPASAAPMSVTIKLGANTSSFATANSTLAVASQDGHVAGSLSGLTFDERGTLQLTYSNGQRRSGPQLALALFDKVNALQPVGSNQFRASEPGAARLSRMGAEGAGTGRAGQLELSNVDLSTEFSELIVMQRGYQASSRVVSTANEMLQALFDMKGR